MTPPRLDEGSEREAFEACLNAMPEWAPEFQAHKPWVEALAWIVWREARAALSTGRLGGEATGDGSPARRFFFLMEQLEKRLPDPEPFRADPPEERLLARLDIALASLAAPAAQSKGDSNA